MRILLVEDEPGLGEAVREHVAGTGHAVDWMTTLEEADHASRTVPYQLILLDLALPDGSGLALLRGLRDRGDKVPVIVLTARDRISDRIEGLNAGADDYLVKPFDLEELSARIMAVSRRYAGDPNPVLRLGSLEIDQTAHSVSVAGSAAELTAREWAVLELLMRRPGALVSKERIEDALYAFGAEIESNAVEVYVSRLRKKLGREAIRTMRGLGYRLEP
ncbi:MAG: response regulator transcription factor [Oceanibaculum nanhaiense]|uniref:response regulator n=1 Tax=Oceanibaculum nanhaiense TaxID=1909734 RepID=UPI0025A45651|nr:response regulator transcription factor [Oceanibaculum nanhaiense]MDM7947787.1 response regulator transcription factor [Oceanibaculum nanhaiense]